MERPIHLEPSEAVDALRVSAVNAVMGPQRLWARDNAWGWSMFSLLVAPIDSDEWTELTAKPIRWTANIPTTVYLPVGGNQVYEFRRGDPNWVAPEDFGAGPIDSIRIRIRLNIPETPEAIAQGVFIGEVLSAPFVPKPPITWLEQEA